MARKGRKFEKAVYAFAQILDPNAEVLFDHSVPDRDTGESRQCDVWINAKFRGHWPLSILVSCKDREKSGRKLDVGHIGTFCDEVRSTGASTGVIYCNTGFTEPAVRKARANGIACCRLYRNEPPDIPEAIWMNHFVCKALVKLVMNEDFAVSEAKTWNDVFDIELENGDRGGTVLDAICDAFASGEEEMFSRVRETGSFPSDWQTVLTFELEQISGRLMVMGHWKKYRARAEAILLDGSYCFSDQSFMGSWTGPMIDVKGYHPGENWIEMSDGETVPPSNKMIVALLGADIKSALRSGLGEKPFEGELQ